MIEILVVSLVCLVVVGVFVFMIWRGYWIYTFTPIVPSGTEYFYPLRMKLGKTFTGEPLTNNELQAVTEALSNASIVASNDKIPNAPKSPFT